MLGRLVRVATLSVVLGVGTLAVGVGAAHASPGSIPVGICQQLPNLCQPKPPPGGTVRMDPCLVDPSLCAPPTKPSKPATGTAGSSGDEVSGGTGASSSSALPLVASTPTVHRALHHSTAGTGSGSGTIALGIGAITLGVVLAGWAGLAIRRRRATV
jgi:hypothetical protein